MNRTQRRRRANRLLYQWTQKAIDVGLGADDAPADETDEDKLAIEDILDRWAQRFFEQSDLNEGRDS